MDKYSWRIILTKRLLNGRGVLFMPRVSKKLLAGEAWMFVIITRISSGRAVELSPIKKCPLIYAPWAI